jgi:hypothetical protein
MHRMQHILGLMLFFGVATGAPPDLQTLLTRPPFAPTATLVDAAAAGGGLEFRGVIVDGGETFFSIFESAKRAALWVGLNEPGNPFTVQSYDSSRETVTVEYQGRTLALTLKQSSIQAAEIPAPAVPAAQPEPAAGAAVPADVAERNARITEEIRRRRALRLQKVAPAPSVKSP